MHDNRQLHMRNPAANRSCTDLGLACICGQHYGLGDLKGFGFGKEQPSPRLLLTT